MSEEDTIANHVNTFCTLIDDLASTGTNISDNDSAIVTFRLFAHILRMISNLNKWSTQFNTRRCYKSLVTRGDKES